MNTIAVACIVKSRLKVSAPTKVLSGWASWARMMPASEPAIRSMMKAVTP